MESGSEAGITLPLFFLAGSTCFCLVLVLCCACAFGAVYTSNRAPLSLLLLLLPQHRLQPDDASGHERIMSDSNNMPNGSGVDASGLRERLLSKPDAPQQASSSESAHEAVKALNQQEASNGKEEKDKKTYGRTPDGQGEYLYSQCELRYSSGRAAGAAVTFTSTAMLSTSTYLRQVNRKKQRLPLNTSPTACLQTCIETSRSSFLTQQR